MKEETKFRIGAWLIFAVALAAVLCLGRSAMGNSAGVTYSEQYRFHGFKLYGREHLHTGANATIRGFDISAVAHADDAEMDDFEYWDTKVIRKLPDLGPFAMNAGYSYLILPSMDAQEASLTLSLPGEISPRYTVAHIVPDNAANGQVHVLGFDAVFGDIADPNAITAVLSADLTYNDGVNPMGGIAVRDFTHVSAALIANLPLGNVIVQPGVVYQHSFEDIVSDDKNECWFTLGVLHPF